MKCVFIISLFSVFVSGCSGLGSNRPVATQTIEYQLNGGQLVVVVPIDGISAAEARQTAMRRAAELTVEQGARYFVIDKEDQVEVMKGAQGDRFYTNMYQEMIIEEDFGKQSIQRQANESAGVYRAVRIIFSMHQDRPTGKSIDACTLTDCE